MQPQIFKKGGSSSLHCTELRARHHIQMGTLHVPQTPLEPSHSEKITATCAFLGLKQLVFRPETPVDSTCVPAGKARAVDAVVIFVIVDYDFDFDTSPTTSRPTPLTSASGSSSSLTMPPPPIPPRNRFVHLHHACFLLQRCATPASTVTTTPSVALDSDTQNRALDDGRISSSPVSGGKKWGWEKVWIEVGFDVHEEGNNEVMDMWSAPVSPVQRQPVGLLFVNRLSWIHLATFNVGHFDPVLVQEDKDLAKEDGEEDDHNDIQMEISPSLVVEARQAGLKLEMEASVEDEEEETAMKDL
ncbi:hypothetical protein CPC08DRAFT_763595 [Agrocybe pediades]|nr:hypothetical protein CPC08DRAFT_763595 [Agrocybe pediades]